MPTLFGLSVGANLEPTLNFHIKALGDEGEALALLIRGPRLFGSSLEKRLKPRLEEALDAGLVIDKNCLQRIGLYTEKRWQSSLVSQSKKLTSRSTF